AREYSRVTQCHRTRRHFSSRRSYRIRCSREWRLDGSGCFKADKQRKRGGGISYRGRNPPSRMREYLCDSAENRLENQRSRWSSPAIGSEANYINFTHTKDGSRPSHLNRHLIFALDSSRVNCHRRDQQGVTRAISYSTAGRRGPYARRHLSRRDNERGIEM